MRVRGQWKYLYRAVDKAGDTIDFLLTAKRDTKAALRFLRKAALVYDMSLLGLSSDIETRILEDLQVSSGVVLLTGTASVALGEEVKLGKAS